MQPLWEDISWIQPGGTPSRRIWVWHGSLTYPSILALVESAPVAPHSSRFHSCNLPVTSCAGPEHIIVTYFYLHRVVTGSLESTATTSFIVAHAFHSAYLEPRESPFPFCSSGIPFLTSYLFLATSFSFSRVVSRKMAASHSV